MGQQLRKYLYDVMDYNIIECFIPSVKLYFIQCITNSFAPSVHK